MKMSSQAVGDIAVIPSGSVTLDAALGVGGYPKGRVIEIFGPESSGKTTLAIHAIAEAQKAGGIAAFIAKSNPADMEALNASEIEAGKTVAALITESIAKIGENISLRRFARYEVAEGMVAAYIHGGGKIGVLVSMTAGTEELGHDVAMHIAAANPGYLNREQVPTAELEHEKAVLTEQARNEGKPEKIIEKMVLGRIQKYYKEVCLVDQEFVKDPDQTVGKLVAAAGASVTEFTRFQLGEGIEKKQEDFAAEVMAQIK